MSVKRSISLGRLLLQIALGAMLSVAGIRALQGHGDDAVRAIQSLVSGNTGNLLGIIFGVIEIVAGILLIIELFAGDRFGTFDNILNLILIVVWIIAIILIDFIGSKGIFHSGTKDILTWIYTFAGHLVVLGSLIYLND
ncbi:MAG: hypothetical protein ACTTJ1_04340 [Treponema sp.]|jgi:hypothetical protein